MIVQEAPQIAMPSMPTPTHSAENAAMRVSLRKKSAPAKRAVRVVLVGVKDESLRDRNATYLPDPSVIAHRVCHMAWFSRINAPAGCSSLVAEVTRDPKPIDFNIPGP